MTMAMIVYKITSLSINEMAMGNDLYLENEHLHDIEMRYMNLTMIRS